MNNKQQTEWRGLEIELAALEQLVQETVEIPNSWLPKEYQHGVDNCRTISNLNSILDKREGLTAHKKKKATKTENVKIYRQSMEDHAEVDYNLGQVNAEQLYRNQQTFVEAQIQIGNIVIDEDE
jgi:hypothetical protein